MTRGADERAALVAAIVAACGTAGLSLAEREGTLVGEQVHIAVRWILGSRTVRRVVRCEIDAGHGAVRWHERFVERSWGLMPPTLSVERSTISGARLSGTRRDASVAGGGALDYGAVRDAAERCAREAGWTFEVKIP